MRKMFYTAATLLVAVGLTGCGSNPQEKLSDTYDSCTDGEYLYEMAEALDPSAKRAVDEIAAQDGTAPAEKLELVAREAYTSFGSEEGFLIINGAFQQENNNNTFQGAVSGYVMTCVLDSLDAPAVVRSHLTGTRALDGVQEDTWDGFSARWSYHPNSGMDLAVWAD